jgi:rubrerythrin
MSANGKRSPSTASPRRRSASTTRTATRSRERAAPKPAAPRTLAEFMTLALMMETEAAQRYAELADAMETHNNREVATLFRQMAEIEGKHAGRIVAEMDWSAAPMLPPTLSGWVSAESAETAPSDDLHYLMKPYHALQIALAGEKRAVRFFDRLLQIADDPAVKKAARELRDEEREHVELVEAWLEKVPKTSDDWADDPDPPRYTD